jgi:AcrR family transcriptional regulator
MEEIARRAGVGKDTLYRRWKSKEALVQHLLTELASQNVPIPAAEDPKYALFVFLQDIVRLNTQSDFGAIIAGIVGESSRNPDLATAFQRFWSERRAIAAGLVRNIVGPTTTDEEIEQILDHTLGPIYYRLLITGDQLDEEYLWDLVVDIPWSTNQLDSKERKKQQ